MDKTWTPKDTKARHPSSQTAPKVLFFSLPGSTFHWLVVGFFVSFNTSHSSFVVSYFISLSLFIYVIRTSIDYTSLADSKMPYLELFCLPRCQKGIPRNCSLEVHLKIQTWSNVQEIMCANSYCSWEIDLPVPGFRSSWGQKKRRPQGIQRCDACWGPILTWLIEYPNDGCYETTHSTISNGNPKKNIEHWKQLQTNTWCKAAWRSS